MVIIKQLEIMKHLLDLQNFKETETYTVIASSTIERKRLAVVVSVDEYLRTTHYHEVTVKGEVLLSNATLIDAVAKYNSIG